jgi:hypothetical protein
MVSDDQEAKVRRAYALIQAQREGYLRHNGIPFTSPPEPDEQSLRDLRRKSPEDLDQLIRHYAGDYYVAPSQSEPEPSVEDVATHHTIRHIW